MKNEKTLRNDIQTWLELTTRAASNIPFNKAVSWDDIENVDLDDLLVPDYVTQSGAYVSFVDVMGDAVVLDQIASVNGGEYEDDPYCELALHIIHKYRGIKLY